MAPARRPPPRRTHPHAKPKVQLRGWGGGGRGGYRRSDPRPRQPGSHPKHLGGRPRLGSGRAGPAVPWLGGRPLARPLSPSAGRLSAPVPPARRPPQQQQQEPAPRPYRARAPGGRVRRPAWAGSRRRWAPPGQSQGQSQGQGRPAAGGAGAAAQPARPRPRPPPPLLLPLPPPPLHMLAPPGARGRCGHARPPRACAGAGGSRCLGPGARLPSGSGRWRAAGLGGFAMASFLPPGVGRVFVLRAGGSQRTGRRERG